MALFLERSTGFFSRAEIARARSVFPVIAGLYRAHLGRLFLALTGSPAARPGKILPRPLMLVDRNGRRVFASKGWREAEASGLNLTAALEKLRSTGASEIELSNGDMLVSEPVDDDFPVAPQGRVFVIEKRPAATQRNVAASTEPDLGERLTPREQQIVQLILQGYPTETIARKLGISRGTVKNHRRRLYYKLDITSERELFLRYLDSRSASDSPPKAAGSPATGS